MGFECLTNVKAWSAVEMPEGENVVISGAKPVVPAQSKPAWSIVNSSSNTWKFDLATGQHFPTHGSLRMASGKRAILAKFPNGDPELSAVHMDRYLLCSHRTYTAAAYTYFCQCATPEYCPSLCHSCWFSCSGSIPYGPGR